MVVKKNTDDVSTLGGTQRGVRETSETSWETQGNIPRRTLRGPTCTSSSAYTKGHAVVLYRENLSPTL